MTGGQALRPGGKPVLTTTTEANLSGFDSRHGNYEVMIRGTFANVRLRKPARSRGSRGLQSALPEVAHCPHFLDEEGASIPTQPEAISALSSSLHLSSRVAFTRFTKVIEDVPPTHGVKSFAQLFL